MLKKQNLCTFFSIILIQLFFSSPQTFAKSIQYDFKPKAYCDYEIEYTYYQLCYSKKHRQAFWALHELTPEQIKGPQARTNDFKADYRFPDPVEAFNFKNSGFDRGHLVPAGDMKLNRVSMSDSFYMTNMSPQNPGFNSGVWNALEGDIRKDVLKLGSAIIVTAPILLRHESYPMIKSGISVPNAFYKIAYFYHVKLMKAYLIPNEHARGKKFYEFKTNVDFIEQITGIDFFSELEDTLEATLEQM